MKVMAAPATLAACARLPSIAPESGDAGYTVPTPCLPIRSKCVRRWTG